MFLLSSLLICVTFLRLYQNANIAGFKFFLGRTVFVGESWGLIKADLLNSSLKNYCKKCTVKDIDGT